MRSPVLLTFAWMHASSQRIPPRVALQLVTFHSLRGSVALWLRGFLLEQMQMHVATADEATGNGQQPRENPFHANILAKITSTGAPRRQEGIHIGINRIQFNAMRPNTAVKLNTLAAGKFVRTLRSNRLPALQAEAAEQP